MKWKFWKKDPPKPTETINKTFAETKTLDQKITNTCISVAAFEGGVVQIHVDAANHEIAFETWKKVYDEVKKKK